MRHNGVVDMKFGLLAMRFDEGNIQYNADKIIECMRQHANKGFDLLCFGEAFLQGFDAFAFQYEKDIKLAVRTDSDCFRTIREAARQNNIAVTFGYYENAGGLLYSSQAVISDTGELVYNFRRVSQGWKEPHADNTFYKEGTGFGIFNYKGKKISIGLCGDLWNDENVKKIRALGADVVFWPVYLDYSVELWKTEKHEYAAKAKEICRDVLLVNSICDGEDRANGGAVHFQDGTIISELPGGQEGILVVEI